MKNVRICSLHFENEDYIEPNYKNLGGKAKLKSSALPRKRKKKRVPTTSYFEIIKPAEIYTVNKLEEPEPLNDSIDPLLLHESINIPAAEQSFNISSTLCLDIPPTDNTSKFFIYLF